MPRTDENNPGHWFRFAQADFDLEVLLQEVKGFDSSFDVLFKQLRDAE